jgi:DNA-binding IclR family transcriptional regulator
VSRDVYYIEVLGKALKVLDVFAHVDKPRITLQEITERSRLSKNTVFRILYTLAEDGYVVKRGAEYELVRRRDAKDMRSIAGPHMDALRDEFKETVNLGVMDGREIRYIDVRESRERFRLAERVGGRDPLHCTALGKSYLAYLPVKDAMAVLRDVGMPRLTPNTITTLSGIKAELARIRENGYAVDREESMPGAFCVGVPILNGDGTAQAALSVSGPTLRFGPKELPKVSRALLHAAARITEQLRGAR